MLIIVSAFIRVFHSFEWWNLKDFFFRRTIQRIKSVFEITVALMNMKLLLI